MHVVIWVTTVVTALIVGRGVLGAEHLALLEDDASIVRRKDTWNGTVLRIGTVVAVSQKRPG